MLGGSGAINYMNYVRGVENDYNEWAALGNPGWDYESVLPYFKKSEGNQNSTLVAYKNGRYHSSIGPLKVESVPLPEFEDAYFSALKTAGVPVISDLNANQNLGYTLTQMTSFNGTRSHSANAYLIPAKDRPNLHVLKYAFVNKILMNKNNEARGVELTYKGKHKMRVYSKKEVIVSAGTIQSPPLLMRSGIGPKAYLEKRNVSCKVDLAVGQNYIDHVFIPLSFALNVSTSPLSPLAQFDSLYQYLVHNTGALSAFSGITARIDTKNESDIPDIQLLIGGFHRGTPASQLANFNKYLDFDQLLEDSIKISKKYDTLVMTVALIKPKSRGVIKLGKCYACKKPIIYSNYLTDPSDRSTLIRAIKQQLTLANTLPLKKIGTTFLRVPIPACDSMNYQTDAYWDCYITYMSTAGSHQVGTSKMGIDSTAVVDPRLRVYKTKGLRQIDAGV